MLMAKMAATGCVSVLSVAAIPPAAPLDALFMRVGSRQTNKSRLVHACLSSPVTEPLVSDSHQYVRSVRDMCRSAKRIERQHS
ncbi:hypothetical protein ACOSQ3_009482 [Xanthoceras sorbifolium]